MTNEEKKKLYLALAAPFPEEALRRADKTLTGRGYSTVGISYQYVVNRLNEVLGLGSWRAHRTITVKEITTAKGRPAFEAICDITLELGEWIDGKFVCWAEALADGGHVSISHADSIKGSYTNALKKSAAMFGCGKAAYEGSLDDDCLPGVEHQQEERRPAPRVQQQVSRVQPQQAQPQEQQRQPVLPTAVSPLQQQAQTSRSRLTSKQLAALWAIARRHGLGQAEFRGQVKSQFNVQPEFLTREQASQLIGSMGNGHAPEATEAAGMPGAEG